MKNVIMYNVIMASFLITVSSIHACESNRAGNLDCISCKSRPKKACMESKKIDKLTSDMVQKGHNNKNVILGVTMLSL